MQPARLHVPPQLLSPSWTIANSPHTLRDILRLPGELRPYALRSFTSLAFLQQRQSNSGSGASRSSSAVRSSAGQTFRYGALRDDGVAYGHRPRVIRLVQHSVVRKHTAKVDISFLPGCIPELED
jgi:hypothetical protein